MHHHYLNIYKFLFTLAVTLAVAACTDTDEHSSDIIADNIINIGGMDTGDMIASSTVGSRADDGLGNVDPTGAEKQKWLIQPLKKGFDITYGLYHNNEKSNERVAILKLIGGTQDDYNYSTSTGGYAEYTFLYRNDENGSETTDPALWYDNGQHYFEGLHVPNRIRYTNNPDELATDNRQINGTTVAAVRDITTDQHNATDTGTDNDLGNYTLLSHYLGMPASTHISATVSRIKLPFQHRLARVLVYVLIDPSLGTTTKLEGYNYEERDKGDGTWETIPDNPETTSLRFNYVEVLAGVKDSYNEAKKIHTLTPKWVKARKVIPHFVREDGTRNSNAQLIAGLENNFVMYTNIEKKTYVFGTQKDWAAINTNYTNAYNSKTGTDAEKVAYAETTTGYRRTSYGKVPLYDIIVRPTYTKLENVMYDENLTDMGMTAQQLVNHKNSIDFSLKLNTGLEYEKHFQFNLDANYQTAVYLVIDREEINYDASGAEKWIQKESNDDWYGLDNENGNTLSLAGNSWQRAYTTPAAATEIDKDGADKITDGGYYNEATQGEDGTAGQYLSPNTWKKYFAQAYEGGAHHGDYFILTNNITIDAGDLPADFVFTGHLDARDHTITLTGTSSWRTSTIDPFIKLKQKKADATGTADKDFEDIPQLYWIKQIAQSKSRSEDGIPAGEPIKFEMKKATPADITTDMLVFSKDDQGIFHLYTNRTFYKKTGTSLFAGIDGNYTTNQESDNPQTDANGKVIWEANVHKETNSSRTQWVPTTGWRAEILNTKVKNGTLFPNGYAYPTSGNVRNSYDVDDAGKKTKAYTNTPTLPQYK